VKAATEGRGVDVAVEAVGHPDALDTACRLARKLGTVSVIGVYSKPVELHMGVAWIKNLKFVTGQANVMGHLDSVLSLLSSGRVDVTPLLSREMALDDAAEAYEVYANREALKIVLRA
jgi:alcohol dehydrogenase